MIFSDFEFINKYPPEYRLSPVFTDETHEFCPNGSSVVWECNKDLSKIWAASPAEWMENEKLRRPSISENSSEGVSDDCVWGDMLPLIESFSGAANPSNGGKRNSSSQNDLKNPDLKPCIDWRQGTPLGNASKALNALLDRENRKISEKYRVLIECWRCMHTAYGLCLYFSEPKLSNSFVYRAECKAFSKVVSRFTWQVHVYQAALNTNGQFKPERYAGVLFVRPWETHLEYLETFKKRKIAEQFYVAPAVVEGYLRPRISIYRSPFHSQSLGFYASSYSIPAFRCIPIFPSEMGSACGHKSLSEALVIQRGRTTFAPHELAMYIISGQGKKEHDGNPNSGLFREPQKDIKPKDQCLCKSSGLKPEDIHSSFKNNNQLYDLSFHLLKLYTGKAKPSDAIYKQLAEVLEAHIYQGLPVVGFVDYKKLYRTKIQDTSTHDFSEKTQDEDFHTILLHSLVKSAGKSKFPSFVFSDTKDLHLLGGAYNVISTENLVTSAIKFEVDAESARARNNSIQQEKRTKLQSDLSDISVKDFRTIPEDLSRREIHQCSEGQGATNDRSPFKALMFNVLSPKEFDFTYMAAIELCTKDMKLTLRDRSQFRGFLLSRLCKNPIESEVHPKFTTALNVFREKMRNLSISRFIWIAETEDKELGFFFDTRLFSATENKRKTQSRLVGVYKKEEIGEVSHIFLSTVDFERKATAGVHMKVDDSRRPVELTIDADGHTAERIKEKIWDAKPGFFDRVCRIFCAANIQE